MNDTPHLPRLLGSASPVPARAAGAAGSWKIVAVAAVLLLSGVALLAGLAFALIWIAARLPVGAAVTLP